MSTPGVAFRRFVVGLLLGCLLGIFYGFLRPTRRGRAIVSDLVFVTFAGWVYLYYGFAVCRGDLRIVYSAAPIIGAITWDRTVGRWLRPIFAYFWQVVAEITRPYRKIPKKLWKFIKFLFHFLKNYVYLILC